MNLHIHYHTVKYSTHNPRLGLLVQYLAFSVACDVGFISYNGSVDLPELCGDAAIMEAVIEDAKQNIDFHPTVVSLQRW